MTASAAVRAGAPVIGAALPAWVVAAVGLAAGVVGAVVEIGASGWLVVALVLVAAATAFPRGPFAALVVVQLAVAATGDGGAGAASSGDTIRIVVLLLTTHLVLAVGVLMAWVPRTARVQLRAIRPTAVRFVAGQVGVQAVAFVVLALADPEGHVGGVWIGVAGAAALLSITALMSRR